MTRSINVYPCPQAATAPVLDGKLDDPVWQQAPLVSGLLAYGGDRLAKVQTSFRVLYDAENLYFGIQCDEPLMDKLIPLVFTRDDHDLFRSETVELFVDPGHSHDLYYQLAMTATGSLYDGRREDVSWHSRTVVKASRESDHWSLEVAIPWADLGAVPAAGKVIDRLPSASGAAPSAIALVVVSRVRPARRPRAEDTKAAGTARRRDTNAVPHPPPVRFAWSRRGGPLTRRRRPFARRIAFHP